MNSHEIIIKIYMSLEPPLISSYFAEVVLIYGQHELKYSV